MRTKSLYHVRCDNNIGSGKTYTLFNETNSIEKYNLSNEKLVFPENTGIVVRIFDQILQAKELLLREQHIQVSLNAQFVEIYNEKV